MTKSYSATSLSMANYVMELMHPHKIIYEEIISGVITKKDIYVYSLDENSLNKYITKKDIYLFMRIINDVLTNVFPKYKKLNNYTKTIVKIFIKLNIPIPWTLPSGAIISQSYLNSKTLKLKPFSFMNFKYNFKTIIKNEFYSNKQRNAIMPNLIHSLDASSIAILYSFFK